MTLAEAKNLKPGSMVRNKETGETSEVVSVGQFGHITIWRRSNDLRPTPSFSASCMEAA